MLPLRSTALALAVIAAPLAATLAATGCKKGNGDATAAAASASAIAAGPSAAASNAGPASAGAISQDAITFIAAGSWEVVDKKTLLLWTVRNNTDKKVVSATIAIYYYDQNKRQIGRKTFDKTLDIEAHRSRELPIGIPHPQEPKGVEYREAVFTKVVFGDGTIFDDPSQAPEKRPYEEPKIPTPPP